MDSLSNLSNHLWFRAWVTEILFLGSPEIILVIRSFQSSEIPLQDFEVKDVTKLLLRLNLCAKSSPPNGSMPDMSRYKITPMDHTSHFSENSSLKHSGAVKEEAPSFFCKFLSRYLSLDCSKLIILICNPSSIRILSGVKFLCVMLSAFQ